MNRILTTLLILINGTLYSQLSPKVSEFATRLSKFERAESRFFNYDGGESEIYKLYDSISKIASRSEIEYLAFNGPPVLKYYFSSNLVESKSKKIKKLFKNYIKSNDSVKVRQGCVGTTLNLANNLYQEIYNLPRNLEEMEGYQKVLKSKNHPIDASIKDIIDFKSKWNLKEAKDMLISVDKIALDDKETPLILIEYMCLINHHFENKLPYFRKLDFFKEKYNSKIITEYIRFCEGN